MPINRITAAMSGAPDINQKANAKVHEVLQHHHPQYIEPALDRKILDRFGILPS